MLHYFIYKAFGDEPIFLLGKAIIKVVTLGKYPSGELTEKQRHRIVGVGLLAYLAVIIIMILLYVA